MTYTASEKLWGIYFQEFEKIIKTSNKRIYHYTSPEAFFEILKKCYYIIILVSSNFTLYHLKYSTLAPHNPKVVGSNPAPATIC